MNREKGYKNLKKGKPFVKNDPRINRKGRPRRLVSNIIEELKEKGIERVSQTDVKDTFLMLINLEISELESMVNDKDQPVLVRIVGKEMLGGKGFDVIEKMLDRAMGRPDSKIDLTSTDGSMSPKSPKTLADWYDANRSKKD